MAFQVADEARRFEQRGLTMTNTTPGMVCAHHHLYSSLARGMPAPRGNTDSFISILENIWWQLDAALDLDMIYWSAALGAAEALASGTTCIIDHHESPNAIEGSLATISKACRDVGVRVNTSYGVTDRWDNEGNLHSSVDRSVKMTSAARRGLDEGFAFIKSGGRGMIGVHAAFTCGDETLSEAAALASSLGVGVHIHVAEGIDDLDAGSRLESIAQDDWLLVHAVHLDRDLKGSIVHNPRSNMNNSVGYAKPTERPNPILLGTDGIGANMMEESRLAYVRLREYDVTQNPTVVNTWLNNNYQFFPEAKNDKVVWSYDSMDSPWHTAFTTDMQVLTVDVDDERVYEDGKLTRMDFQEVRSKAREQAQRLFERLEA
jgi:cytosine/adenosine deaminase-related metal-dependent hydrolase